MKTHSRHVANDGVWLSCPAPVAKGFRGRGEPDAIFTLHKTHSHQAVFPFRSRYPGTHLPKDPTSQCGEIRHGFHPWPKCQISDMPGGCGAEDAGSQPCADRGVVRMPGRRPMDPEWILGAKGLAIRAITSTARAAAIPRAGALVQQRGQDSNKVARQAGYACPLPPRLHFHARGSSAWMTTASQQMSSSSHKQDGVEFLGEA